MHRIHNQVRRLATASPTVNTPAQEDTEARINPEASAAANRSLDEQQAALNLLYLSREFGAGGDSRGLVDELIVSIFNHDQLSMVPSLTSRRAKLRRQ